MQQVTPTNKSNDDESEQLFTYDDIPLYARVYHNGKLGWVTMKGEDALDRASGNHIRIQYKHKFANRKRSHLHEKVVNTFLEKQETLWVDFDYKFTSYEDQ